MKNQNSTLDINREDRRIAVALRTETDLGLEILRYQRGLEIINAVGKEALRYAKLLGI